MNLEDLGKHGVLQMPDFIHDFGDGAHHMSMVRTCEFDDFGSPIRGTGPSHSRYVLHCFLDDWGFYPAQRWLRKWVGDNKIYAVLRSILGFFWGLNCFFPPRDVALYTVWDLRGCKPVKSWTREEWENRLSEDSVYPSKTHDGSSQRRVTKNE